MKTQSAQLPIFQQAVRRKSWTLNRFFSGSGTQSKGRSHMFAIFSQALSWSEASFRRDVPSTPWSFPRSWPLLTSFHLLALAQVAVGPFKWIHYHTHFHWKDTDCIIQSMNFPAPHVDGIPGHSWHGNLAFFFRPVSLHSGNPYLAEQMVRLKTVWKREFHVKYNICDNGAANNTQPCMLFIACSKTSRRAWHGSIDSGKLEECCIGWCSETSRI